MSHRIVEVDHLSKSYGTIHAVDDLNFSVDKGDVYGFLGPNGAGKSTTIRMLLSLIKPTSGNIRIFGKELKNNRNYIFSKIGSIVEKPDFYRYLSAFDNLNYFSKISGKNIQVKRIYELLELVGLNGREKEKVKGYSHGMKQRLGIAQTLLADPDLIILDEPTTGLDPQGIIDIRHLISYLQKEKGKTILLSSHILSEIELIATRMIIINKGKSVVEGSVNELLSHQNLIVRFSYLENEFIEDLLTHSSWNSKIESKGLNEISFSVSEVEIGELNRFLCSNQINVTGIESKRKLEDYFLKLVN